MLRTLLAALGLLLLAVGPASAVPVDVELVLAIDVSRSVDDEEAALQRDGYIRALNDPRVIRAIQGGPHRAISVAYVEWAAYNYQKTVIDWTVIKDPASAKAFTDELARAPRLAWSWTSISGAIDYSARMFRDNGYEGARLVIDISGDGVNNHGRPVTDARDEAVAQGIVINGLPIINERANFGRPPPPDLDLYYERNVVGGPGANVILAQGFGSFAEAILNKLIKEIAGTAAATQFALVPAAEFE